MQEQQAGAAITGDWFGQKAPILEVQRSSGNPCKCAQPRALPALKSALLSKRLPVPLLSLLVPLVEGNKQGCTMEASLSELETRCFRDQSA